jgi:hypothetical protein
VLQGYTNPGQKVMNTAAKHSMETQASWGGERTVDTDENWLFFMQEGFLRLSLSGWVAIAREMNE